MNLLQTHKLDFHSTFRTLCSFRPSLLASESEAGLKGFVASLVNNSHEAHTDDVDFTRDWCAWLAKYAERVENEMDSGAWAAGENGEQKDKLWEKREKEMRRANPRFILRQWVLEEIIKRVQDDIPTGQRALAKVHEVSPINRRISIKFSVLTTRCYASGIDGS